MDNQPASDRSILIPIFISGFSVVGIIVVLLIGRALSAPAEVPVTPSATRFSYVYLGTEPIITTPLIEETEGESTEPPIVAPEEPTQALSTPTRATPPTLIVLGSATNNPQATNITPTPTVTTASAPPLNPGTYDDGHQYLLYNGWEATGALHVSFAHGSTISFRFIGTQLRIGYEGGNTLGQATVTIDNVSETLDQSDGNSEWIWPNSLANVTHTVLITHTGGGPVNLDEIIIPSPSNTLTPTPTLTRRP